MQKDLIVVTCPEKMYREEETMKNFKAAIGDKFKELGRDVDLLFLSEGINVEVIKGNA